MTDINFGWFIEEKVAKAVYGETLASAAWPDLEWEVQKPFVDRARAALNVMHVYQHVLDREYIITFPLSTVGALTRFLSRPNGSHSPVHDLTFDAGGAGVMVRTNSWTAHYAYSESFRLGLAERDALDARRSAESRDVADFGSDIEERVAKAIYGSPGADWEVQQPFMVGARAALNAMNVHRHLMDRGHVITFPQSKNADLIRFLNEPRGSYSPTSDLIFEACAGGVRVYTYPWTQHRDYAESLRNGSRLDRGDAYTS